MPRLSREAEAGWPTPSEGAQGREMQGEGLTSCLASMSPQCHRGRAAGWEVRGVQVTGDRGNGAHHALLGKRASSTGTQRATDRDGPKLVPAASHAVSTHSCGQRQRGAGSSPTGHPPYRSTHNSFPNGSDWASPQLRTSHGSSGALYLPFTRVNPLTWHSRPWSPCHIVYPSRAPVSFPLHLTISLHLCLACPQPCL